MPRVVPPLPAALSGAPFLALKVVDQTGRHLVQHRYPGVDGAEFEDLGQEASVYTVDGRLFGPRWLHQLKALKRVVEGNPHPALHRLQHPFLGVISGRVPSLQVVHVDREHDTCTIQFRFVEGVYTQDQASVRASLPAAAGAVEAAADALASAAAGLP